MTFTLCQNCDCLPGFGGFYQNLLHTSSGLAFDVSPVPSSVCQQLAFTDVSVSFQNIETDEKGHIKVDEFQNTSRAGIYALGDVCGRALLTPGMKPPHPPTHHDNWLAL